MELLNIQNRLHLQKAEEVPAYTNLALSNSSIESGNFFWENNANKSIKSHYLSLRPECNVPDSPRSASYLGSETGGDYINDFLNMGSHLPGWEDERKVKFSAFEEIHKYWGEHNERD